MNEEPQNQSGVEGPGGSAPEPADAPPLPEEVRAQTPADIPSPPGTAGPTPPGADPVVSSIAAASAEAEPVVPGLAAAPAAAAAAHEEGGGGVARSRPELAAGGAFAAGFLFALILKRLAR